MNRTKLIGAIGFPAFLAIWSVGLVFAMGHFHDADAAPVRGNSPFDVLPVVPSFADADALAATLSDSFAGSEVFSGRWQPRPTGSTASGALQRVRQVAEVAGAVSNDDGDILQAMVLPRRPPVPEGAPADGNADERSGDQPLSTPVEKTSEQPSGKATEGPSDDRKRNIRPPAGRISGTAVAALHEARTALADGRADLAYGVLIDGVAEGHGDAQYLGLLAVTALQVGRPTEAQVLYEKLTELQPDETRWWAGLALALEQRGVDAKPAYRELLALADSGSQFSQLARHRLRFG